MSIDCGCGLCCGWYLLKCFNCGCCDSQLNYCKTRITTENKILFDIETQMKNKKQNCNTYNTIENETLIKMFIHNYLYINYKHDNQYEIRCLICMNSIDNSNIQKYIQKYNIYMSFVNIINENDIITQEQIKPNTEIKDLQLLSDIKKYEYSIIIQNLKKELSTIITELKTYNSSIHYECMKYNIH